MSKTAEKFYLFITDFITVNVSFLLWIMLRHKLGYYVESRGVFNVFVSLGLFGFWFLLFAFFGYYRTWFAQSRTDEFIAVLKTVTIGVFVIFLITFDLEKDLSHPFPLSRLIILIYWVMMVLFVGFGRILLRTVRRRLLEMGVGRRRTLIVGWGKKAKELFDRVVDAPALGYEIVGFVTQGDPTKKGRYKDVPIKGHMGKLSQIIRREAVQEVLVALPRRSERYLEEVITQCDGTPVGIKIVPDLYDVITGQVRTNQIYGFPLIEIFPQLMPTWERAVKRMYDVLVSLIFLVGFLPMWLIVGAVIRMNSKGPIFYNQKRVGKDGKLYNMIKFRSMVMGAEKMTGPVWAASNDPRVTKVGRLLRRLRLDEIPQLVNVLWGHMSLVGPRPERPFFVEKLKKTVPLYSRRLRIRPGITGWAQVKGDYDQSIEHVKQKLEYDLFYLENMSLRMDLKIILNTLYVMIRGKGH